MRVVVKALHMKLSPSLKDYAEEKLRDAVLRVCEHDPGTMAIELVAQAHAKDRQTNECRVLLHLPHGHTVVISEVDDTMHKAIDLAHDRLLLSVKREREKRHQLSHRRKMAGKERHRLARMGMTVEAEPWRKDWREQEIHV